MTKEVGTDLFAPRFNAAGYSILAFDYRRFGESGGQPRQLARIREQLADWRAAIDFAASLRNVDAKKIAIWGFSLSGGHVFPVAARHPRLAAAIAQTPVADGSAVARYAMRYSTPSAALRLTARALQDALGRRVGRAPVLVPLGGHAGSVAVLTTPDGLAGARALDPDGRYSDWRQEVAAASGLRIGFYRPGRYARHVKCPLLIVACEDDTAALPEPAARAASRAPRGELVRFPGGHYAPFLEAHEAVIEAELDFLSRHIFDGARHATPHGREPVASPGR